MFQDKLCIKHVFFDRKRIKAIIKAKMSYQDVREPLRAEDADKLSNACNTAEEKLIIWTLLDTGLRVSELCNLTSQNILWQQKSISINGKGGPHGKKSKKRVVPMSRRIQALLEHYLLLMKNGLLVLDKCRK